MKFIQLIQEHYPTLTKSEKKIADYLLAIKEKTIYSTMSEIKEMTNVGDATIVRFCQKLGFSGFSDLKIAVAKEDFGRSHSVTEPTFYDQILNNLVDALHSTRQLINEDELTKAISAITKAKHLYIFGVGSSGNTSMNLENMFLRVGVHCKAVTDPHFQAQSASLLDTEDVVIGFSLSGRTKDTYDSLKVAKENGATTIAITNYLSSPLAKLSEIVLQTSIEEFLDGGSLAGIISQLYVCNVLVQGYELQNQVDTLPLREKALRAILDKGID
ncbi:MurR/RpiR family transcriptional regulator [Enterococcus saccharolyticus]|uniref:RpiR family transcriptional regulator n=1 Tax=Candidatus Enterococcus willemsii TaxID=1857215 RepID=A0ABQ6Z3L0_9ENTE|nr:MULTISPECIES: MurR/RpiR family transcriptional regulator [Enterococcus]KAF1306080.1 RpiR family transcriptional regulator [Enterococcus sp. CU12B]MCD5002323.1 MurR/RpiR family transcriptional regulator [Enterococcus saccharolyticus]